MLLPARSLSPNTAAAIIFSHSPPAALCLPPAACSPQGDGKPEKGVKALAGGKGFVKDGVEYK